MDLQEKLKEKEVLLKDVQDQIQENDIAGQKLQVVQVKHMGAIEVLKELIESEEVEVDENAE